MAFSDIAANDLHWRSDQKVEYFPLSASSSTTTSNLLPAADNAETKLRRARNRPKKKERIVGEVCCVVLLVGQHRTYVVQAVRLKLRGRLALQRGRSRASALPRRAIGRAGDCQRTDCKRALTVIYTSNTTTPLAQISTFSTTTNHHIHIMAPVTFWAAPRQYINWAARHKPAILWSLVLGSFGPLIVV